MAGPEAQCVADVVCVTCMTTLQLVGRGGCQLQTNIFEYRENAGPTHDLAFNDDEIQFLIACVGREFFADMATSTNLYAAHSGAGTSWYDTNEREMRFFFGVQIMMGIKQQPEYRDYWSLDPAVGDNYISSRITRNRYTDLSKYLHLTDPATEDGADKLTKVQPFLTHLQRSFPQLFTPGVALSLDEAMIKYNGCLKWKLYMPEVEAIYADEAH